MEDREEDLDSIIDILNKEPEKPFFTQAKNQGLIKPKGGTGLPPILPKISSKKKLKVDY